MAQILLITVALLMLVPGFFSAPLDVQGPNCATHIYVFATTSLEDGNAGTNELPYFIFGAKGNMYMAALQDLPEDQARPGYGDLWRLSLIDDFVPSTTECIRKSDITSAALVEKGSDGWLINSVSSMVRRTDGNFEALTFDMDIEQWIDGDDVSTRVIISLHLV